MKTLTWNTEEEAKALVGKKVRMSEQGIKKWDDQAEGGAGTIVNSPRPGGGWIHVEWDMGMRNDYLSGDLLLAEPEAALDTFGPYKVGDKIRTHDGAWHGTVISIEEHNRRSGCVWAKRPKGGIPCQTDDPRYYHAGFVYVEDVELDTTAPVSKPKLEPKPEPVKAETVYRAIEPEPWTCSKCGKTYPGRRRSIEIMGVDVDEYEIAPTCAPCVQTVLEVGGIIKRKHTQTRLEALRDMAASGLGPRPSEIAHKHYPRGGDR